MAKKPRIQSIGPHDADDLFATLKMRFERHKSRHGNVAWKDVRKRLEDYPIKFWSIGEMERTGGEPDVTDFDRETGKYLFVDCSTETPKGRRSVCYDREGLDSRKEHKPENTAIDLAEQMGIEILDEEQYRKLQTQGEFDLKTSSWVKTPPEVRKLGGALFGDRRYGQIFIYHNGAQSYYATRAFRGMIWI